MIKKSREKGNLHKALAFKEDKLLEISESYLY
jgi:hypothetical protein